MKLKHTQKKTLTNHVKIACNNLTWEEAKHIKSSKALLLGFKMHLQDLFNVTQSILVQVNLIMSLRHNTFVHNFWHWSIILLRTCQNILLQVAFDLISCSLTNKPWNSGKQTSFLKKHKLSNLVQVWYMFSKRSRCMKEVNNTQWAKTGSKKLG